MRFLLLTFLPVLLCGQASLHIQMREDQSLKNHGVLITTAESPDFQKALADSGQTSTSSTINPALSSVLANSMVVTNGSSQPITHITVRYIRIAHDGSLVPYDSTYDVGSIASAVQPGAKLLVLPTGIQLASAPVSAGRITFSEQISPTSIFASGYAFIDSIEFADGKVIGPDTLGYMAGQKIRSQVLKEIRDKLDDGSITDAELTAWLKPKAKAGEWMTQGGPQGGGMNQTVFQNQKLADMALTALQQRGREYARTLVDRMSQYQNRTARVREN